MDKLRAMTSFVRIVDRGSLTAAAADLGVSLPSMVRTLATLERELGATLLNRTTRRLHLTDDGRRYLERCRAILGQVQEAEATLSSRRAAPSGRLAVTASALFGQRYIAPLMSEFLRRHPEVSGELLFVDRIVNLVEEGIDAAVRIGPLPDSSLVAIPLGKVRRVMCASPAYLRANGTPHSLEDLRERRSVRVTGLLQTHKVSMASVLTCNQAEAAIEACTGGLGIGSFVSYMVAPQVRAGRLKYVLEDFEAEPIPVNFLYPQSRQLSPAVRAFADLCVKKLRGARFD
jgi:DNA-binding transcriptional LysR family regulator